MFCPLLLLKALSFLQLLSCLQSLRKDGAFQPRAVEREIPRLSMRALQNCTAKAGCLLFTIVWWVSMIHHTLIEQRCVKQRPRSLPRVDVAQFMENLPLPFTVRIRKLKSEDGPVGRGTDTKNYRTIRVKACGVDYVLTQFSRTIRPVVEGNNRFHLNNHIPGPNRSYQVGILCQYTLKPLKLRRRIDSDYGKIESHPSSCCRLGLRSIRRGRLSYTKKCDLSERC